MSEAITFSWQRTGIIIFVAVVLAILISGQIVQPIRQQVSERYVERGDTYLVNQEFDSAEAEYQKAINFNSSNTLAAAHLKLARQAAVDIAVARDFYQEHHVDTVLHKLDVAQKQYANPRQALQYGVSFYEAHDFAYAQYPLRRALELDPEYPEAWHYLGLTYYELAKTDPQYKAKAVEAIRKQNELTPKYLTP